MFCIYCTQIFYTETNKKKIKFKLQDNFVTVIVHRYSMKNC